MPYQQSDLDALNAAIATGALRVRYADGRDVLYRSLREMRLIQTDIIAALSNPLNAAPLRIVGGYRSGLS